MTIGGNVIRVFPRLDTSGAYSNGDVLFNAVEIPNAVRERGGVSKVVGISATCADAVTIDCELIFHQTGGIDLVTFNAQPDITDSNFLKLNFLGIHKMINSDWLSNDSSADSATTMYNSALTQADQNPVSFLLKADEGSKSVYVSALSSEGSIDFAAATDLSLIIHVEYL